MQYGLAELEQLALSHLKAGISAQNVIHECFSRFSSINPAVLEMELKFVHELNGSREQQSKLRVDIQTELLSGAKDHHGTILLAVFGLLMQHPVQCSTPVVFPL